MYRETKADKWQTEQGNGNIVLKGVCVNPGCLRESDRIYSLALTTEEQLRYKRGRCYCVRCGKYQLHRAGWVRMKAL